MVKAALAKLQHRCERLTSILAFGTSTEISAARELLRQSLVEPVKETASGNMAFEHEAAAAIGGHGYTPRA